MSQDQTSNDLRGVRREYEAGELHREMLKTDPVAQFAAWFAQAKDSAPDEATSMTLATADKQGMPAARIVLLKHFDTDGFAWYTDYRSDKGRQLADNPQAALLFYWPGLERQVRIQGRVERLPLSMGEDYFNQRPLGSRLSAAASEQSAPIASREELEAKVEQLKQAHPDGDVPHPPQWGGYRLIPEHFEFWQGRASRLHDRFTYRLENGEWLVERLQP